MDQVRNEEVGKRVCYERVGLSSRTECIEVVWTHGREWRTCWLIGSDVRGVRL